MPPICHDDDDEISRHQSGEHEDNEGNNVSLAWTKSIAETMSLPHEIAFVSTVCMAQFFAQASLGQGLSIINIITSSFNITNPGQRVWVLSGFALTVGTFILLSGRLGDLFGYKRLLIAGFLWYALWSLGAGCAVYSTYVLFVFARIMQGIGPAVVLPNALAILGATYKPGKRKAMVFAVFAACAPVGDMTGAAMAGVLALAWWPWAFWAQAIACAVVAVLSYLVVPELPKKTEITDLWAQLDPWGSITGSTALVLINVAWKQAPLVGWRTPYVYTLLTLRTLLLPLFIYIERHKAKYPLIPFAALTTDVTFVLAIVACGWSCFGIWIQYSFFFYLNLRDASPLLATAFVTPVVVLGTLAALVTGWMLGRFKPALVLTISLAGFTFGEVLIMTAPVGQSYWYQAFWSSVITPWGMDMSFPAATLILSNAVAKEHQGIAASLINTVVNYSISVGLGLAGTVEVHVHRGADSGADILKGYRGAWYTGVGLAGLGLGLSIIYLARSYWHNQKDPQSDAEAMARGKT